MKGGEFSSVGSAEAVQPPYVYEPPEQSEVAVSIARFTEDLANVHDGRIRRLPSFSDSLNHRGMLPVNVEKYRRMSGVYMTEDMISETGGPHVPKLGFEPKPFRRLGRENSRRQVFFGNLELIGNEAVQTVPVAVKPFVPSAFHHTTHEIGMFQFMEAQGIPTLQVLGMVAIKETDAPRAYEITRMKQGITTLDNEGWQQMTHPERWQSMRPAIESLALLHSHMLFHGDMEFKNVAYGEEDRSVCIVDPEEAISLRDRVTPFANIDEERLIVGKKVSADLESLRKSTREFIIGYEHNDPVQFEDLLEHVYGPYYLTIMRMESPYKAVLLHAFEEVLERKRAQAYGEI